MLRVKEGGEKRKGEKEGEREEVEREERMGRKGEKEERKIAKQIQSELDLVSTSQCILSFCLSLPLPVLFSSQSLSLSLVV